MRYAMRLNCQMSVIFLSGDVTWFHATSPAMEKVFFLNNVLERRTSKAPGIVNCSSQCVILRKYRNIVILSCNYTLRLVVFLVK